MQSRCRDALTLLVAAADHAVVNDKAVVTRSPKDHLSPSLLADALFDKVMGSDEGQATPSITPPLSPHHEEQCAIKVVHGPPPPAPPPTRRFLLQDGISPVKRVRESQESGTGHGQFTEIGEGAAKRERGIQQWSCHEDRMILAGVKLVGTYWERIARQVPGRTPDAVRNRCFRLHKAGHADAPIGQNEAARWRAAFATETAHQVVEHANTMESAAGRLSWTAAEDEAIADGVRRHGQKWRAIASALPGRSDSSVRNRWMRTTTDPDEGQTKHEAPMAANSPMPMALVAAPSPPPLTSRPPHFPQQQAVMASSGKATVSLAVAPFQTPPPLVVVPPTLLGVQTGASPFVQPGARVLPPWPRTSKTENGSDVARLRKAVASARAAAHRARHDAEQHALEAVKMIEKAKAARRRMRDADAHAHTQAEKLARAVNGDVAYAP